MTIPLAKALRRNFPDSQISWVIDQHFLPLLRNVEGIHFIPVKKIKSVADYLHMKKVMSQYSFDVLLATQASFSAHLFYSMIRARRKIGYDAVRSKDFHSLFVKERISFAKEHTIDGFMRFAKHLGASDLDVDVKIPLLKEDYSFIQSIMKDQSYYVINPFSAKKGKDWLLEHYIEVGKWVYDKSNLPLIITGSKADQSGCDYIKSKIPGQVINLAGQTSLRELAAILGQAKFLLSPDTGPLHIASAMQIPVIGLYAASSSDATGCYFSREYTIDKHEKALEKIGSKRKKRASNQRLYKKNVMHLIQVQDVIEKISMLI